MFNPEKKIPEATEEQIASWADQMASSADRGSRRELNEGVSAKDRSRILAYLMEKREVEAIDLNAGEFPPSFEVAEWLFDQRAFRGAATIAAKLPQDKMLDMLLRLLEAGQAAEVVGLLGGPYLRGRVPPGVASELVRAGKVGAVGKYVDRFAPGLSEDVALALIACGSPGVAVFAGHKDAFTKSSQAVFDALVKESPLLLRFIASNLSRFQELDRASADLLRKEGFAAEVDAHPECFV